MHTHTHTACGIAHLHLTPGILGGLVGALASLAVTGDVWPDTAIAAVLFVQKYLLCRYKTLKQVSPRLLSLATCGPRLPVLRLYYSVYLLYWYKIQILTPEELAGISWARRTLSVPSGIPLFFFAPAPRVYALFQS